jgi:hypothetical protein
LVIVFLVFDGAARYRFFSARSFLRFCWGVFEKSGVLTWCFGGEVVVFCVVDVVFWQSLFRPLKM